jgi:hypothetical protein|tara:strand:+ start:773 stop:1084 length:312 start_codon:yes stop_codon:yes gene_type:complete
MTKKYFIQKSTGDAICNSDGGAIWIDTTEADPADIVADFERMNGYNEGELELKTAKGNEGKIRQPAVPAPPTLEEEEAEAAGAILKKIIDKYGSLSAAEDALK